MASGSVNRSVGGQWSIIHGSVEDVSVLGVGGLWRTCPWFGGQFSVVVGSIEDLSVDRWSVFGGLSVIGGFVIRPEKLGG